MDLCWQINISAFQYGIKVFRFTQNAPVFFQPRGVGGEGEMERLRVECNESDWGKMPQPRHQSIRWSWQRCSNVFTLAEAIIKKPLNEGAWVRNADMYVSMAGPASLVAQTIKKLPAMWENQVDRRSLEKGMEPHSSILVWRSPWTEEPRAGHNWRIFTFLVQKNLSLWLQLSLENHHVLAVHQGSCGEGSFPHEACQAKPCDCLWSDVKNHAYALCLVLDSSNTCIYIHTGASRKNYSYC